MLQMPIEREGKGAKAPPLDMPLSETVTKENIKGGADTCNYVMFYVYVNVIQNAYMQIHIYSTSIISLPPMSYMHICIYFPNNLLCFVIISIILRVNYISLYLYTFSSIFILFFFLLFKIATTSKYKL